MANMSVVLALRGREGDPVREGQPELCTGTLFQAGRVPVISSCPYRGPGAEISNRSEQESCLQEVIVHLFCFLCMCECVCRHFHDYMCVGVCTRVHV